MHVRAAGVVDQRELQQRAEHERQADAGPHVDSLQQTGRTVTEVRAVTGCMQGTSVRGGGGVQLGSGEMSGRAGEGERNQ